MDRHSAGVNLFLPHRKYGSRKKPKEYLYIQKIIRIPLYFSVLSILFAKGGFS
jgi:hypothetical protein